MKIAICSLFVLVCFDTHIAGFSIRVSLALLCLGTVLAGIIWELRIRHTIAALSECRKLCSYVLLLSFCHYCQ